MSDTYKTGTIPVSGDVTVNIANQALPATITITDVAGTRAIQLSFDSTNFAAAVAPTVTEATFISYALTYPAASVKLTGTAGAVYNIRSAG